MAQHQVQLALQKTNQTIANRWKKEQKVDLDEYRTLAALETAAAACTAMTLVFSAANTAHAYLFGANGVIKRDLEAETERMRLKLLQLLSATA